MEDHLRRPEGHAIEIHISNFDATVWIGLFLAAVSTVVVGCLGFSTRFSSSKNWLITLCVLAGLTIVLIPIAFHRNLEEMMDRQAVLRYTFHPVSPTVYDGLLFPAGSTVIEDPHAPHAVTGGNVPDKTPLLGLVIRGDFMIDGSAGARELVDAVLAAPGRVHGVPCAVGEFKIEREITPNTDVRKLSCMLAADYTIDGLPLKADTSFEMALDHSSMQGTLAAPWKAPGADCAAGEFLYDGDLLECTLLHEMTVSGYGLAGGEKVSLSKDGKGEWKLYRGVLAHGLEVLGVEVPAGSEISASDEVPSAEKLRAHELGTYETVDFLLPKSAHLVIQGVDIRGDVRMSLGATAVGVTDENGGDEDHVAGLHHDGVVGQHGTYKPETKTWCWEQGCWQ